MICLIQFPAKCFHVIAELWNDFVVAHKCTLLKTNSNPTSAIYQDHCCILSIYVRKPNLCIERSASLPGHSMVFWCYPSSQLFEPQSHSKEGRTHTQPLSSSDTLILSPSQSDIGWIKRVSLYQGGEWERYKLLKMPQIQAWWNVPCTFCESHASIWNCMQICIEDSTDKRMAQSSKENVRSLWTKNTGKREWILWSIFTNFHLLRGSRESPVKITRVRSERWGIPDF